MFLSSFFLFAYLRFCASVWLRFCPFGAFGAFGLCFCPFGAFGAKDRFWRQ